MQEGRSHILVRRKITHFNQSFEFHIIHDLFTLRRTIAASFARLTEFVRKEHMLSPNFQTLVRHGLARILHSAIDVIERGGMGSATREVDIKYTTRQSPKCRCRRDEITGGTGKNTLRSREGGGAIAWEVRIAIIRRC